MSARKYEFTGETRKNSASRIVRRIRRISDGLVGGWIEKEDNLSHNGYCFVHENAEVYANARVLDDAQLFGNARVFDNAQIYGAASVFSGSKVFGNALVYDRARVYGDARVFGAAWIYDDAQIFGNAQIYGHAKVLARAWVYNNALVFGDATVLGDARFYNGILESGTYNTGRINTRSNLHRLNPRDPYTFTDDLER